MSALASGLPRVRLGCFPTPLVRAHRLERALGRRVGPLLVKRDDLAGFGLAGNKTRPLEFLLGAALARGATVFLTGGSSSSNFCPAAAMAARAHGLDCELVIWGEPAGPNIALALASGARLVLAPDMLAGEHDRTGNRNSGTDSARASGREAIDELVAQRAGELADAGRRVYAVPRGGSTGLGAVGFALAAVELAEQLDDPPALIVLPVGSGGSCAGLLVGLAAAGLAVPVLGVSVSRPLEEITVRVRLLAKHCATLLGIPPPAGDRLELIDARGPGFGLATELERERAKLLWGTEGLPLDSTYGAETCSAAIDRLLGQPSGPVVWWHTGGLLSALRAIQAEQRSAA